MVSGTYRVGAPWRSRAALGLWKLRALCAAAVKKIMAARPAFELRACSVQLLENDGIANTKILKLQHSQNLQNMNYAIYINNKIKLDFLFRKFQNLRMHFGIVDLFCTINCYFEYWIRIPCIFCIWDHFLNVLLNIFRPPKSYISDPPNWHISQKCEHFPYRIFWGFFGLLVLTGPLTSLKHPSEGGWYK